MKGLLIAFLLIIGLAGIGLLTFAGNRFLFLAQSEAAMGTVLSSKEIELRAGTRFAPIVRFTTKAGSEITFQTSLRLPKPRPAGDTVEVLYLPGSPANARINDFSDLWVNAIMAAGFGGVFLLISVGVAVSGIYRERSNERLKKDGMSINAEVTRVEINTNTQSFGRSPYCIHAHWQDPATSHVHIFVSDDIWVDPTKYIGKFVKVIIDPKDPARYFFDLSFLPPDVK